VPFFGCCTVKCALFARRLGLLSVTRPWLRSRWLRVPPGWLCSTAAARKAERASCSLSTCWLLCAQALGGADDDDDDDDDDDEDDQDEEAAAAAEAARKNDPFSVSDLARRVLMHAAADVG
jgi:hypothetical protein